MKRYLIRIYSRDNEAFIKHLGLCGVSFTLLSALDFLSPDTILYSIDVEEQDILALKLSFPIIGCLDFNKTTGKVVNSNNIL